MAFGGPPSGTVVVWQWTNDEGDWSPYDAQVSNYIEDCYSSSRGVVRLGDADRNLAHLTVDIRQMVQKSSNGTERPIRRELCDGNSAIARGAIWQWGKERMHHNVRQYSWHSYSMDAANLLEAAFSSGAKGSVELDVSPANEPYVVDLNTMQQINKSSGFSGPVQRLRSSCSYRTVSSIRQSWHQGSSLSSLGAQSGGGAPGTAPGAGISFGAPLPVGQPSFAAPLPGTVVQCTERVWTLEQSLIPGASWNNDKANWSLYGSIESYYIEDCYSSFQVRSSLGLFSKVSPDDVMGTEGIQLRVTCTLADKLAMIRRIKKKKNEELYYSDQDSIITDVETLNPDENNDSFTEYCSKTRKNGEVTRLSLPFGLGQLVSDWIGSPGGLLSLIRLPFSGNNVQVTNRSTQFGRGKAGDGMSLSGVDELFHCEDKVEKSADVGSESDKGGEGMFLHVEYSFLVKCTTGHEIKKSADGSTEVGRVEPGDEMSLSRNGVKKRSDVGIENGNDVGIGNGKAGDGMSLSGDEVKENADVGIENGNDEPGNRKTGDEMSLSEEVKKSTNVRFRNGNTGAENHKAGKGMPLRVYALIFVMLLYVSGGKCAAIDSYYCNGTLLVNTTLEYGEIFSFMCPISGKNGLKLYADGPLAYNGYGLSKNYSWLQVKCFEDGRSCNITITAGVDTPKCFVCLEAGPAIRRHFLIRSEPKDVKYVSAGFTNPDVKTVSAGFANSGVVVVLVAVLAVHIFLWCCLRAFM